MRDRTCLLILFMTCVFALSACHGRERAQTRDRDRVDTRSSTTGSPSTHMDRTPTDADGGEPASPDAGMVDPDLMPDPECLAACESMVADGCISELPSFCLDACTNLLEEEIAAVIRCNDDRVGCDCGATPPPDPPPTSTACTDTCGYAGDGDCDDGGPGSDYSLCELGTDCTDCGPRPR